MGRGASGETYVARDTETGTECVVKVFDPAARGLATEEFRSLTSLSHPSVVRVRHVGRTGDGRPFLVTDLVAGAPLASLAGVLDDARRRQTFETVARQL